MKNNAALPLPCEVADVGAETEVETETEEVGGGKCARTRLYRRMDEIEKAKKYQFSFPASTGKKVDRKPSTLSARDEMQISLEFKKLCIIRIP